MKTLCKSPRFLSSVRKSFTSTFSKEFLSELKGVIQILRSPFLENFALAPPRTVEIKNFLAAWRDYEVFTRILVSMGKKKAKKRAVSYNDFQNAYKQAECGAKNWQKDVKRSERDWKIMICCFVLDSMSWKKQRRRRLKPNKRKRKNKGWKDLTRLRNGEPEQRNQKLSSTEKHTDVPQAAELNDELHQEPNLDLAAIDDIIEEELAMPLQSEKGSEETFDADDAKLEIHLQKFAEEKIYPTPAQAREEKHIAMLDFQKVQEYFQKVSQNIQVHTVADASWMNPIWENDNW